jgi:hypothetical protein
MRHEKLARLSSVCCPAKQEKYRIAARGVPLRTAWPAIAALPILLIFLPSDPSTPTAAAFYTEEHFRQ